MHGRNVYHNIEHSYRKQKGKICITKRQNKKNKVEKKTTQDQPQALALKPEHAVKRPRSKETKAGKDGFARPKAFAHLSYKKTILANQIVLKNLNI